MSVTQSLIFNSKEEASAYLKNLTKGYDGKHMIARYWTSGEGSDIASVEGILHFTNGVRNVEIKGGEGGSSSGGDGTRGKVIVKQSVKLKARAGSQYFFNSNWIKFEMPSLGPNSSAVIHFPGFFKMIPITRLKSNIKNILAIGYGDGNDSLWDMLQAGALKIEQSYDDENNERIILLQNLSDSTTTGKFSLPMLANEDNGVRKIIYVREQLNSENKVDANTSKVFYYTKIYVYDGDGTYETTSPGFMVEEGKLKCYRASDFKHIVMAAKWAEGAGRLVDSFKYIKDGTVFYYSKDNMLRGKSPKFVRETRAMFDALTTIEYTDPSNTNYPYYIRRDEGALEFVSPVRKPRLWWYVQSPSEGGDGYICTINCKYIGLDESDNLVFQITKSESTSDVRINRIIYSYTGPDGNTITGYFNPEATLPASGGTFEMKHQYSNISGAVDSAYLGDSVLVKNMEIKIDYENEMYMMSYTGLMAMRATRTRWHNMSTNILKDWETGVKYRGLRNRFRNHKFHRCRYIQKFKGVPSEFPEYFYVR